jgi:hypothetical protein
LSYITVLSSRFILSRTILIQEFGLHGNWTKLSGLSRKFGDVLCCIRQPRR